MKLPVVKERCTGHCCHAFWLPYTYGELLAMKGTKKVLDIDKVVDMVIPTFPSEESSTSSRYMCRHFDWKSENCTNYDERPDVCRRHGVEYGCNFKGCTLPQLELKKLGGVEPDKRDPTEQAEAHS